MAPTRRSVSTSQPPLPPDSADYIVFAFQSLESKLDTAIDGLNDRFNDAVKAAQQRGDLYAQRDEEWSTQISTIANTLATVSNRLTTLDNDVRKVGAEVHELHAEQLEMDVRLAQVEKCREKVEQHLNDTRNDHLVMTDVRSLSRAGKWVLGFILTVFVSVSGIIPLIDRLWPHP